MAIAIKLKKDAAYSHEEDSHSHMKFEEVTPMSERTSFDLRKVEFNKAITCNSGSGNSSVEEGKQGGKYKK